MSMLCTVAFKHKATGVPLRFIMAKCAGQRVYVLWFFANMTSCDFVVEGTNSFRVRSTTLNVTING